jgi:hypothetical protein
MHLDAYIRLLLLPYWRYPAVPSVLQLGTRRCVKDTREASSDG